MKKKYLILFLIISVIIISVITCGIVIFRKPNVETIKDSQIPENEIINNIITEDELNKLNELDNENIIETENIAIKEETESEESKQNETINVEETEPIKRTEEKTQNVSTNQKQIQITEETKKEEVVINERKEATPTENKKEEQSTKTVDNKEEKPITTSTENKKETQVTTSTENKEDTQKKQEVVRCTNTNNHGMDVGNSGKWFSSKQEAIAYYDSKTEYWSNWLKEDPKNRKEEYLKNCPSGYEVWDCMFCGKWTINFYYR